MHPGVRLDVARNAVKGMSPAGVVKPRVRKPIGRNERTLRTNPTGPLSLLPSPRNNQDPGPVDLFDGRVVDEEVVRLQGPPPVELEADGDDRLLRPE